ncbi:MAG: polyamine aminopropyltransferase [Bacillota bacterium]|nr:polyamine aminopropyltransferase [Bacillota bacterium]
MPGKEKAAAVEFWFTEKPTPNWGMTYRVQQVLRRRQTAHQDLAVVETAEFGRALILDGIVQLTEKDEFVYHEMIVHVPMCAHPNPRRVLVVGGGDGGAVREILRHPAVEEICLVDIDGEVIEAAREFFPRVASGLDDPRVHIVIEDASRYLWRDEVQGRYDVILVDSPDPVGPAIALFKEDFYRAVYRALAPDGLFAAQSECPFLMPDFIRSVQESAARVFPIVKLYIYSNVTYPGGMWAFTTGSKRYDPACPQEGRRPAGPTRYWTPEVHRAAFVLPPFVQELAPRQHALPGTCAGTVDRV